MAAISAKGAEVVRSVLFEYTRVLNDVTLNEMIVFKDYSIDRAGEMKHTSEYSSDEWLNARDRRRSAGKKLQKKPTNTRESKRMKIYPVILSGGAGTRLWPLSRAVMPKQLLPLVTDKTMLQETALRVSRLAGRDGAAGRVRQRAPLPGGRAAARRRHHAARHPARAGRPQHGPGRGRGRALPARAIDPEAVMLVLPADHVIEKNEAFRKEAGTRGQAGRRAVRWPPSASCRSAPETGYGYIRRGEPLPGCDGCYKIERFVEKPDRNTAEGFVADGGFYWNSGMFMFRADRFLAEMAHAPDIAKAAERPSTGYRDLDFCRLDEAAFSPARRIRSTTRSWNTPRRRGAGRHRLERRRFLVGAGRRAAARRQRQRAARRRLPRRHQQFAGARREPHRGRGRREGPGRGGNPGRRAGRAQGPGPARQEHRRAPEGQARTEHLHHTKVYRPWGHYEGIDAGDRFQVKRITVKPGEKLSLQMHHHRAEHWVVVSGTARVTCGDKSACCPRTSRPISRSA
jgi:mannose-1-phosphate guanylyltransferase/mannose-6-phosphate isomerase